MPAFKDRTGFRYGRWVVLGLSDRPADGRGNRYWDCICDCGKHRAVVSTGLQSGMSKSCGCLKTEMSRARCGNKCPAWRGGRVVTSGGYIMIMDKGHPNAQKVGYVFEHIAVMTEHLGRPLAPKETVHHLDGDKTNNKLENLELFSHSHAKGQRVADKVQHAIEILRQYNPEALK